MKILFVCTGNTCRSPLAAGIFNAMASKENLPIYADSCGIMAFPASASSHSVEVAKTYGADIGEHMAKQVTEELVEHAEYIFCMTGSHCRAMRSAFPQHGKKIFTLAEHDISDPYGGSLEAYEEVGQEIYKALEILIKQLKERIEK